MGNTYPEKDGKNPLEKSVGNMPGSIDILKDNDPSKRIEPLKPTDYSDLTKITSSGKSGWSSN